MLLFSITSCLIGQGCEITVWTNRLLDFHIWSVQLGMGIMFEWILNLQGRWENMLEDYERLCCGIWDERIRRVSWWIFYGFQGRLDRIASGAQLMICFRSETSLTIHIPDEIGFGNNKNGYLLISWTTLTYER